MCGIQYDHIHMRFQEGFRSLHDIRGDAQCRTAEETPLLVFRRIRILHLLLNVLDGDQAFEITFLIHNRKFLHLCPCKNRLRFFQGRSFFRRNEILRSHTLRNRTAVILFKNQIPVRDDADQFLSLRNRHTGDAELCHEVIGIFQTMSYSYG